MKNMQMPQPSTQRLAGIEWREHYNCYSATIAGWFHLGFSWSMDRSDPGYRINVGGRILKVRGTSAADAAQKAVLVARKLLLKASVEVETAAYALGQSEADLSQIQPASPVESTHE